MKRFPFMPWYTQDWFADPLVQALTYEEQGIYLALLGRLWESEDASLPNEDAVIAKVLRLPLRKWQSVRAILLEGPMAVLTIEGDVIRQNRLTREHAKARATRQKQSAGGRKGRKGTSKPDATPFEDTCHSDASELKLPCNNQDTDTDTETHQQPAAADVVGGLRDDFDAAAEWVAAQLHKTQISSGDWPVLKRHLEAVGDLPTYQRILARVLDGRDPAKRIGSLAYFDGAVADWTATHELPKSRAAPRDAATEMDLSWQDRVMAGVRHD